jgi:ACS family hexuronate transporter-like MFS transporter
VTSAPQRRFAWTLAALLFAGSVLNYVDRSMLGVLMPQIRRDLSLSNEQYGYAVNAFLMLYAAFYILGGKMSDRLGYKLTVFWSVLFWSVANALHAFATGLRSLCLYRALLGIGEGVFYPAAIRCYTERFPPASRAKAVGLLLSGLSVGTLVTPPVAAWILVHWGWRAAFVATGAAGLILLPPWILLHRRTNPSPRAEEATRLAGNSGVRLGDVLRCRKYWAVLSARAVGDAAWYFYLFWMPGYFQEVRGFAPAMVGKYLWVPYFCAGAGALAGAWASSALIARGIQPERGRKCVLFPSALCASLGAFVFLADHPAAALALASVALFGHQSWSSNLHTVITEICPPRHVAILYGITGAAGTLAGALSQPLIGRVVDLQGYGPSFAAAGLAYFAAAALLLSAGRLAPIVSA